jgi:membrane protein YdbS with pleckstrin-like domain
LNPPPQPDAPHNGHAPVADLLRGDPLPYDPDAAPSGVGAFAEGSFSQLHPNALKADRLRWALFGGFFGTMGLILFVIFMIILGPLDPGPWLVLAGALVPGIPIFLAGVFLPKKTYRTTTYAISELGLEIRRGIWWKHLIDVPRSRIQHTDVQQGPLARHFGLGKLVVYTAGTEHASVELDGLEHGRAIEMRDFLLRGGEDDAV